MIPTKVQQKTQNQAILEKLLQNATIEYEDGCAGIDIENDTHYLYIYDRFNDQDGQYSLFKVIQPDKEYQRIELTQSEKEFLQDKLYEVWEVEYEEEQTQKAKREYWSSRYWLEEETNKYH